MYIYTYIVHYVLDRYHKPQIRANSFNKYSFLFFCTSFLLSLLSDSPLQWSVVVGHLGFRAHGAWRYFRV
jgi:hypothetical protein